MRGPWRIARIMGIDISIDWTWFIIPLLMVYSLGFVEFPRVLHPRVFLPRVDATSIVLGVAASILLFASVLAHELSHSWMALQRGIPVSSITLFILGGVAQIADEPDRPGTEFLIAIMGPLMSVALAALFGAAWLWLRIAVGLPVVGSFLFPIIPLMGVLAQANGALALFNLAPGFPLDGGRVLRAILWGAMHDVRRATRWATRAGQLIAVLMAVAGAWLFITEFNGGGIWYILIAMFLWNAAGEGNRQVELRQALAQVRVNELMTRSVEYVEPRMTINQFVAQHLLPHREQTFGVSNGLGLLGTVASDNVLHVPRSEWDTQVVENVMTPLARLESLAPLQTVAAALYALSRTSQNELPVLDAGQLIGFLGRSQISRFLRLTSR